MSVLVQRRPSHILSTRNSGIEVVSGNNNNQLTEMATSRLKSRRSASNSETGKVSPTESGMDSGCVTPDEIIASSEPFNTFQCLRKQMSTNNNTIELPEYIVDKNTKITYLKGKFLGKGGFASVHQLTDLTTNRVYAGKIIPKSRLTKPHQREKIFREVDLHKPLRHKHIVRFHHFFQDENNVYIVLEYCQGKSLVHVLKNRKTFTEPEVRYYMRQLCLGVQYCHSQGVIHRDLKLGNMFLSDDMTVKIGDFGLAARASSLAEHSTGKTITVCGTPNYIAPEVLNMNGHGVEADIWAMGCIMYAMLVGYPPFETPTLGETYHRIRNNVYTFPAHISESARSLIKMMLKSRHLERPGISDILGHEFFSRGYEPKRLSSTCCISAPKFTVSNCSDTLLVPIDNIDNALSATTQKKLSLTMGNSNKSGNCIRRSNSNPGSKPRSPCLPVRSITAGRASSTAILQKTPPEKLQKSCGAFRQRITSALCPDTVGLKRSKIGSTLSLYQMLNSCVDDMAEHTTEAVPKPLQNITIPFITKWIDYSNKYGFAFQLSDHSIGVLFNDTTRLCRSSDKEKIEYHDVSGRLFVYSPTSIPSSLKDHYLLLLYFADYMEEHLTEGGDLWQHQEAIRKKNCIPYMKRWIRRSHSIVMQLSCATLQVNFFKDHTKIVFNGEKPDQPLVMYIDENRETKIYSLRKIADEGCDLGLRDRIRYALEAMQHFLNLELKQHL